MKLIIDVPDNEYEHIREYYEKNDIVEVTYSYIYYGTPLPKGHGRLIDADELTKQLETVANDEWNKQVGASKGLEDAIDIVDDEPTIIKAEGSE